MKAYFLGISALLLMVGFISCGQPVSAEKAAIVGKNLAKGKYKGSLSGFTQATFAAGCFWHEETLFETIKGVKEVISGYAGGNMKNPTYEDVETGATGHAETVNIYYDSSVITYPALLKIYFESQQDPTQVNGQGNDRGTQYRSIIFYRNMKERALAEQAIKKLNESKQYHQPIAAQVLPYTNFWKAEEYHQDYIDTHTDEPYITNVCIPEIERFQEKHPELVKPGCSFAGKY